MVKNALKTTYVLLVHPLLSVDLYVDSLSHHIRYHLLLYTQEICSKKDFLCRLNNVSLRNDIYFLAWLVSRSRGNTKAVFV